ncbi:hypothetical protein LOTGIDRAFT_161952 [Lottia gigantea]|uniref:Cadherin domain-containing protein n=2 Tax=Lottia gigantea TaxID=225164 RepID=V4AE45_LOTGI|nr:hypothetical protein LOTGIDRAFT_161952 [Lottia gigantea]ESO93380.1 hypothetical protein LOTGIDRAFT_161952 [Lottia gigantea]
MSNDFQINVQDHGGLNASKILSITVLDKNDEAPQFVPAHYRFNISEDSGPSTSVGLVSAFDKDNDGNSSVRYILDVNGDGRFFIDGLTGVIRVAGGLDREIEDKYVLKVVAEDQSGYTGSASVVISIEDANDEPPKFTHDVYNFTVPENIDNITIGAVEATDRDIGFNGQLTFSVTDPVFSIDQNGSITLNKMFDRENMTEYKLIVTVHDGGRKRQLTATTTIVISITDVNDNDPVFCLEHTCPIHTYNTTIVNELPTGSFVFLVATKDQDFDSNGTVSYQLIGETSVLFNIGPTNGLITTKGFDLNDLEARRFLSNNETSTPTIRLEIVAVDGGGRNQSAYLEISILVIEAEVLKFNKTSSKFMIHENKPKGIIYEVFDNENFLQKAECYYNVHYIGTSVGSVSAYLGNVTGVKLTYSVLEDDAIFFSVERTSGIIKTKAVLNRELNDKYLFVIQVIDDRNPQQTAFTQVHVTVVDENDSTPKFDQSSYSQSIVENISNVTVISVTARDLDSGRNGDVIYSIVQGNQDDMFQIDEITGDLNLMKPADREEEDEFNIIIMASDLGSISLNSTVDVTILIEDENDNAPVISIEKTVIYVRESKRQVTQIIQINATDADSNLNGEVLYSISTGDKNVFQINPINGWVSTMRSLLTKDETEYKLTILAYDLGQLPLNSSIDLIIRIINSTTPQFSRDTYSIDGYVGMKSGTVLNLNLTAGTGHYDYHIVKGNIDKMFSINSTTGQISLVKDVKDQSVYSLQVEAVDLADKESKDTVNVIISVRQPNVKFDEIEYKVNVKENLPKDFLVIDLNTTVEFEGIGVLYRLEGDDDHFTIDKDNGSIFTNTSLDREITSQYILIVRVTSLIGSSRRRREAKSDTTRIIIRVDDENDNPPYFPYQSSTLELSIPQAAKQNYHLTTLKANDPDDGDDFNIEYRITTGDDQIFNIDKQSGKLTSLVDMTDIDKDQFNLVIQSIDTNSSLSSNISLKIYVVPNGDRYILTGNITLPVFVNYQEMFLKNLSAILNMTVELDNVQPHAKIEDGKKVIDNDRTDVYIKASYRPENEKLVPWHVIQREVRRKKKAIEELFSKGQSFVTDATPIKITNDEGSIGIPEMTLLGLACAIFVGSVISIVIVIRSWTVHLLTSFHFIRQEAKQNKIQMALMARQKISRETTFSDTICDSDSAVMELNQNELKKRVSFRLFQDIESLNSEPVPEPELVLTVTEEQEKTLEFGNETSDGDTVRLRNIILAKTVMDVAREIHLANQNRGTDSAMSSSKPGEDDCGQKKVVSENDYCKPISNVNQAFIEDQTQTKVASTDNDHTQKNSTGSINTSKYTSESLYETIKDVEDNKYELAEESEDTDL